MNSINIDEDWVTFGTHPLAEGLRPCVVCQGDVVEGYCRVKDGALVCGVRCSEQAKLNNPPPKAASSGCRPPLSMLAPRLPCHNCSRATTRRRVIDKAPECPYCQESNA